MKKIKDIIAKYKIDENNVIYFGNYLAKINPITSTPNKNKKLILVTATSPTPAGEGKTTISIGLSDALNKLNFNSIVSMREPSIGPTLGYKGGANGGGLSQVHPKDDINLHFTGDIHAITTANNYIAACIDNEIYWDSPLKIDQDKIVWKRVMDVNDRSLRDIQLTIDKKRNIKYKTSFMITAACELMTIFCLSKDWEDLKERIQNMLIAYSKDNKPLYVKDLNVIDNVMSLLVNAFKPNLAQSTDGNLAIIHGGPFANLSIGCNTIIGTKTALNISDYVVTEAGFGSDLGCEKFIDIVSDHIGKMPDSIVLVTSIRSIKYNGNCPIEDLTNENLEKLKIGFSNLLAHINNIRNYNIPFVVAINHFHTDTKKEIELIENMLNDEKVHHVVCTNFVNGTKGIISLAEEVVILSNQNNYPKKLYELKNDIITKINKICTKCYKAKNVEISEKALEKIKNIKNQNDYYVCISKTQYSFTDDPKINIIDKPFTFHINDVAVYHGSKIVVAFANSVILMPGLPKRKDVK